MSQLVTAKEIADLLGISLETVWRYTRTGRIPAVRLSKRRYRYDPVAVTKALHVPPPEVSNERSSPAALAVREAKPPYRTDSVFTYDDYLQLPGDGCRYQILDGVLVREPAPHVQHQRVARRLLRLLESYFAETDPQGEVFTAPTAVTLSETDVVEPDLLYVTSRQTEIIETRRINGAPHLVVEIVSPWSGAIDRVRKRALYERLQVLHYWLVDYEARTFECLALDENGKYVLRTAGAEEDRLEHPDFPGLAIDLAPLWRTSGP